MPDFSQAFEKMMRNEREDDMNQTEVDMQTTLEEVLVNAIQKTQVGHLAQNSNSPETVASGICCQPCEGRMMKKYKLEERF